MNDTFLASLIDEQAAIEALASILAYEQKALTTVDPAELLTPLLGQKTELVSRLTMLEKARNDHLRSMGLPIGLKGMEVAASKDARLATQWTQLKNSAERARSANRTNGTLVRTRMDYNRRALAALQIAPPKVALYGPDGRMPAFSTF